MYIISWFEFGEYNFHTYVLTSAGVVVCTYLGVAIWVHVYMRVCVCVCVHVCVCVLCVCVCECVCE